MKVEINFRAKRALGLLACAILFAGCATNYQGRTPDFSKTGLAARDEIGTFTLRTVGLGNAGIYEMGRSREVYTIRSLMPVIAEVSPVAERKLKTVRTVGVAHSVATVGVIAYFLFFGSKQSGAGNRIVYWSFLGSAIGVGFWSVATVGEAKDIYNDELKKRFAPTLSVNWNY